MGASAAASMKLGFSSTPTHGHGGHAHSGIHPMFGAFDPSGASFSGIASSLASISGAGVTAAAGAGAKTEYSSADYSQDFGKGGVPPGHMDIPAVAPGEKWFQGRLQFMLSQRGKPLLVHDGHSFGIQYIRKDKKYWQCNLSRKYNCKARVTTTDTGDIIVTNNEHCHTEIRQHLRKDYKSMKQLNASLAALRARQDAVSLAGLAATSVGETSLNNNNNSLNICNNNNNNVLGLGQEQETSLNLSTSNWQLKKEPTQGNE